MAKVRVYELAKYLGVDSQAAMAKLQELGVFVRSASSSLEEPTVSKLINAFRGSEASEDALERLRARLRLPESGSPEETEEDDEWEEVTDEEFRAWERSRLAADHEQAEIIAEEISASERERQKILAERDRRYQAAMTEPATSMRHMEETSDIATVPEEIYQLREELNQLRNEIELATRAVMAAVSTEVTTEMVQLRTELATRAEMAALRTDAQTLREEMTNLRHEVGKRATANDLSSRVIEIRDAVGGRAAKEDVAALRQELQCRTSTLAEVQGRTTSLDRKLREKTTVIEEGVARLRKQVGALKREVADLSRQREESFYEESRKPPRPVPSYQSPPTPPYRGASDMEHLMGETPRAIYEQQKAREYDPYRDRD
ncbi:translation initiation factor IF-2 N-terminal domain-containing protein [Streptomyces sp. NBC_00386]